MRGDVIAYTCSVTGFIRFNRGVTSFIIIIWGIISSLRLHQSSEFALAKQGRGAVHRTEVRFDPESDNSAVSAPRGLMMRKTCITQGAQCYTNVS